MLLKKDSFFRTVRFSFAIRYFAFFISLLTVLFFTINQFSHVYISKKSDKKIIETLNDLDWIYTNRGESYIRSKINNIIEYKSVPQGIENVFYVLYANDSIISSSDLIYWPGIDSLLYNHFMIDTVEAKSNVYWLNRIEKQAYIKQLKYKQKKQDIKIGYFEIKDGVYFILGLSLEEDIRFKKQLSLILGLSFCVILLMGFVFVFYLINKVMASIETVTDTAVKIEKGDLSKRVELTNNKREISSLIISFNKMLERINVLFYEIKGVSNDIAHDLRSPLTSIRALSETALSGSSSLPENKQAFEKIIVKCDYLVSMINTLLEIVEIESNTNGSVFESFDMKEIVTIAYELYITSAEERDIKIDIEFDKSNLYVLGNRSLIQRAISNVIDNAIKYNKKKGQITISVYSKNNMIEIVICDTGIGIAKDELGKIFNKFYRVEKSRSKEGNGLGLSLVNTVIKKHNGHIHVTSEINKGTCFSIKMNRFSKLTNNITKL